MSDDHKPLILAMFAIGWVLLAIAWVMLQAWQEGFIGF